jgi:hypothetical protein
VPGPRDPHAAARAQRVVQRAREAADRAAIAPPADREVDLDRRAVRDDDQPIGRAIG